MIVAIGTLLLLVFTCGPLVRAQAEQESHECSVTKVSSKKVTISSGLGVDGNLVAKVVYDNDMKKTDNSSWRVEVEEDKDGCDGVQVSSRLTYTLTAPIRQHRLDYELFPGIGYFKFHPEVATWPRAREICSEEDAHLVILNSEQESSALVKMFQRSPKPNGASHNDWFWAGLQERASANGLPYTIFGKAWNSTGFMRWGSGQPRDQSLDDYILINRYSGAYGDIPIKTGWKVAFICEQELSLTT